MTVWTAKQEHRSAQFRPHSKGELQESPAHITISDHSETHSETKKKDQVAQKQTNYSMRLSCLD